MNFTLQSLVGRLYRWVSPTDVSRLVVGLSAEQNLLRLVKVTKEIGYMLTLFPAKWWTLVLESME